MHGRTTGEKSYNKKMMNALPKHGFASGLQSKQQRGRHGKSEKGSMEIKPKTTERVKKKNQRYYDIPGREPQGLQQGTKKREETTNIGHSPPNSRWTSKTTTRQTPATRNHQ